MAVVEVLVAYLMLVGMVQDEVYGQTPGQEMVGVRGAVAAGLDIPLHQYMDYPVMALLEAVKAVHMGLELRA